MSKKIFFLILITSIFACKNDHQVKTPELKEKIIQKNLDIDFDWENATIYFMLTDRFNNGDKSNDYILDGPEPAPYRGFMGGDIKGITQKIESGYFSDLGVNAIWMTPLIDQILGSVDEGTGISYPFHGYWARDWTKLDSRFGTMQDLKQMVETAHSKGIRVLLDVVANHTGPVTEKDPQWPDSWVKTGPRCTYKSLETTVNCTLVDNLPDIKTESEAEVDLPPSLVAKWKSEGRYEQEVQELDAFFTRTGLPRRPVNYIFKWLVDYVEELGVDGFRVDTAKHTEAEIWDTLKDLCSEAFDNWKRKNPAEILDDKSFYMMGEVYNFYASAGRAFDYGDQKVDFYNHGFDALINFDFKTDAEKSYEEIFSKNDKLLHGEFRGKSFINYISSHDDGAPFDQDRSRTIEAANKLLLSPGAIQIYYGDESARSLSVEAKGDAILRAPMNWDEIEQNQQKGLSKTKDILTHWQKLGQFRDQHRAIGMGKHLLIENSPYTFSREYDKANDQVVIALDAGTGKKSILVKDVFENGTKVNDAYSGTISRVEEGKVEIDSPYRIVLLEKLEK